MRNKFPYQYDESLGWRIKMNAEEFSFSLGVLQNRIITNLTFDSVVGIVSD
jgi:hypothetical protein